ncbi:hypothetical protein [Arenimonas sp. GDDSR-1]|uniref:hypothetical protein n=1 Tax=Arenimonas sp. GDDSR-1 TaxID=2950125 RepID=UPI00261898B3|nr:hypothetical protein [Arenimonas sp. GDDSR-1]
MSASDALQSFTGKYQAQWPELSLLQGFLPERCRPLASAWGALLCELQDCAFAIEQEAVRTPKSLWWADELQRMASRQARHPLTIALQDEDAGYDRIAGPLLAVSAKVPLRAGNTEALHRQLLPLTAALAGTEAALFGGGNGHDSTVIAVQLLLMRLPGGLQAFDRAMVPMHLLARHQAMEAPTQKLSDDWLGELRALLPEQTAGNAYREAQRRFIRRRLSAMQSGKQPRLTPAYAWDAWRAVRRFR